MDYRREIDGLRAFAVLPVILFHAGFQAFSGGFVGVDVFFVISGFLITSIILAEINAGTFTLLGFYERRARRILPALFAVMAACLPLAWLWLVPQDMNSFSDSLVAVSAFASNILFWRTSGYFDTANELKPLLHTWSLAVEEQYYLFFPVFLMLAWRLGKRWVLLSLLAIAVASLVLAKWASIAKPDADFYLLPTRGWELLIGAFVAFYFSSKVKWQPSHLVAELGGFIGLLLLAYSIFAFNSQTPFPSLYTLAPTVGAALIILFATPSTIVGRILGSGLLVGIGLISYSAYLWHQPILAFARHRSIDEPSQLIFGVLAIASLVAAYFTWKYIETPFRNRYSFSRKHIFAYGALTSLVFVLFGLAGHFNKGFSSRFTPDQLHILSYGEPAYTDKLYKNIYRRGVCFLEPEQDSSAFGEVCQASNIKESVLIWGDSHAAALSYGLRNIFPSVSQYTASGCPPIKDAAFKGRPQCKNVNDFVLGKLSELSPKKIFLHANWALYGQQEPVANLHKTITYIRSKLPAAEIFVIGPVPQWEPSLPIQLFRRDIVLEKEYAIETTSVQKLAALDSLLREEAVNQKAIYLSPIETLCSNGTCPVSVIYGDSIEPMAWDYGHLTEGGSVVLARKLFGE